MFEELETPCFIFDPIELERSVNGFRQALNSHFNKCIVGYSVKTNSLPACMNKARKLGVYAEVVSADEYDLAIKCGFEKSRIIYNGPMKSKETFLEAVENRAIVNIETKRELAWLRELPARDNYNVGLRLNVNISHLSPEDSDGENDNSRFGFSDETNEFADAVRFIENLPNVRLTGLHIHRTSHSRSVRFYKASLTFACQTIQKYGLKLDYLDVGGGYFGIFPNKPTYQEYSDAFYEILSSYKLHDLCVVIEPGNALVASSFAFLSEVIDVKHTEENLWFVTTDGSRNDIDPFFKKKSYLSEVIYKNDNNNVVAEQIVSGCTCLEYDRLFTLIGKPLLSLGDCIYYRNVGAYTMCLSPLFIRYYPKVYMGNQAMGYELVRDKWSANEYLMKNKF